MPKLGEINDYDAPWPKMWEGFEAGIVDFLKKFDLSYYSYVQIQNSQTQPISGTIDFKANYEPEWISRYCNRRYDQVDPVCHLAKRARSPFCWGTKQFLSAFPKQQRQVFWEGRDYGIYYGLSIPVRGIDGQVSVVSFTGKSRKSLGDVIHDQGSKLHVAAYQICDYLTPKLEPETLQASLLTIRERECLIWVSQGLTSEEIAERIFLSVSTVNYHLGNVVCKLDARNRHHAALLALSRRLI
ncbi:autoinducer binding domain-containing protein [uncultured Ruegeria sp.]|uniref:autoinducer binding domain-containing protein n=1 Tax=uncultured Ruegeria sp. TaxID=259304 RepID=UPI00262D6AC1|nr:autoinducer binding domain-containing protein [uncultured Ruegeria sp.]